MPHTSSGSGFSEQWTDLDIEKARVQIEIQNLKINTIKELAERIFDLLKEAHHVRMDAVTMCTLHRLTIDSTEDVIFFYNAGGQPFHCWAGTDIETLITMENQMVFAYRLKGTEHINKYPMYDAYRGYLFWTNPHGLVVS